MFALILAAQLSTGATEGNLVCMTPECGRIVSSQLGINDDGGGGGGFSYNAIVPPTRCDAGWSIVTVNGQPWCAKELKAPSP